MDKGGDATPPMSGFSNAKGHINKQQSQSQSASSWRRNLTPLSTGFNGSSEYSEKSKKEKVRSLSAVAKALSMGCRVSHSPKPTKKFKFPRKFTKVGNGVDHASVPRKIRSAVKKRGRESISGDSEKVNHKMDGMKSPQKDGIKKSKKQRSPCWSTRQVLPGPITKDEEEVAETLYALAGMLPDNDSNTKSEPDSESLPENSRVFQDQEESQSANVTVEASGATTDDGKRSPKGCKKLGSLSETIGHEQTDFTDFPDSANFLVAATQSTVPKVNLQAVSMVKSENGGRVALHDSELSLDMGLNVPIQPQISHIGRKSNVEYQTVGSIDRKQEQHMVKYQKETESPTWWPSLSPTASPGIVASHLPSSAAKTLDWLNTAIGTSKQDLMETCSSGEKISEIVIQEKKSRKRCASHVHISHIIRSLEVSRRLAGKGHELYESHQARLPEGSNCGVIMEAHNLNWTKSGNSNAAGTVHSAAISNSRETKNGILHHGLYHDISRAPSTSGLHGPKKQGFNFLSLSTGGSELKVNESFNKGESKLEPYSKSQVPYFQSLQQQHGLMPFQSPYASNFLDHLPVVGPQVRLQQQQPHYYGTPLRGAHYSSTLSYKQQHQSFWAVQLASQGGSSVNCSIVRAQYPNWQSGGHDSSVASPCLPHSTASFEALGSKISSISDQQHLFTLASSISRANGQDIHLASSVCEESKGRLITQQ
ncbi:uncharacterized protein LOC114195913 isoform X2 [Vigna unguiculata]|uniref:Uncharacterized protein n=1 Tax=Vigna unguiculata TaxID=3917 RepID=A0A4D6NSR4_VIGUN|nr:uncharacterized protein LOC114195913 isoform X2 [Vigna unguiculata]QCE16686.1 hypothetical protein DEO72_LG11g3705 [Vigna unguiculata]